jgi:hypothetical protein
MHQQIARTTMNDHAFMNNASTMALVDAADTTRTFGQHLDIFNAFYQQRVVLRTTSLLLHLITPATPSRKGPTVNLCFISYNTSMVTCKGTRPCMGRRIKILSFHDFLFVQQVTRAESSKLIPIIGDSINKSAIKSASVI